ncbi:MAG: CocE/NonD family hydrolase [Isosphaeraceae bacterium]|nr:CocE/NonD family hydrolase [Isosphaeraceae bacterium]
MMRWAWIVLGAMMTAHEPAVSAAFAGISEKYVKSEHRIPMRDGTHLFTVVYTPRDRSRTYPILIERTPYGVGPYGVDEYPESIGPSAEMAESGYIFVHQDVRGCYMSEGEFEDIRPIRADRSDPRATDESTDARDTIAWLLANLPNHNGRVGIWGISYPGFYAIAALIDAHPALAAVSPQAPVFDWFLGDDTHHNGALFLQQEFNFDAVFGVARPRPTTQHGEPFDHGTEDGYAFFLDLGPLRRADELYFRGKRRFWSDVMKHGTYDEFWKARAIGRRLGKVDPAVLTVGGWYDAQNLYGALNLHATIERVSPGTENLLVMGPWSHGGWSREIDFTAEPESGGVETNRFYRRSIEMPFFEHHLKGRPRDRVVKAWVWETGRRRARALETWPPRDSRGSAYHLGAGGRLSVDPPAASVSGAVGYDEYVSDPARPVPYTAKVTVDCRESYMLEDQRFLSGRPDVLGYRSDRLEEPLTIAGPIAVELFVSTDGTDADWVLKLIEVLPGEDGSDGEERLVRGDVMRGRFRESFEHPKGFTPGVPTRVAFSLPDCFHTFRAGSRVMVQIQSSWFPLVDRNPQSFVDIATARASDFRASRHRVHREPGRASRLILPVVATPTD